MAGIVIPLVPEKLNDWKSWIDDVTENRKEEFADFNNRMGLTAHRVWLNHTPNGPVAVVLHDGPGSETFLQKVATSDHPFDQWFRERITEFHGIDPTQPPPGPAPEALMNWETK
jgi:hypothetical protein